MTHLSPFIDVPLQTPSYAIRAATQRASAHRSDVTPATVLRRQKKITGNAVSSAFKAMCKTIRRVFVAHLSGRSAPLSYYAYGRQTLDDQACLCVCSRVILCGCMCVFVGLSGEPGQSVRCGNGGFKDKRCGEFPGCLLPSTHPSSSPNPAVGMWRGSWAHR